MSSTLTIRLPETQRQALKLRAEALKITESALIRDLVEREVGEPAWDEVVARLAGSIDSKEASPQTRHPLEAHLRGQNWRS